MTTPTLRILTSSFVLPLPHPRCALESSQWQTGTLQLGLKMDGAAPDLLLGLVDVLELLALCMSVATPPGPVLWSMLMAKGALHSPTRHVPFNKTVVMLGTSR